MILNPGDHHFLEKRTEPFSRPEIHNHNGSKSKTDRWHWLLIPSEWEPGVGIGTNDTSNEPRATSSARHLIALREHHEVEKADDAIYGSWKKTWWVTLLTSSLTANRNPTATRHHTNPFTMKSIKDLILDIAKNRSVHELDWLMSWGCQNLASSKYDKLMKATGSGRIWDDWLI